MNVKLADWNCAGIKSTAVGTMTYKELLHPLFINTFERGAERADILILYIKKFSI